MSNLCDSKNIVHTSKSRRIAQSLRLHREKPLPEHPAHRRGRVGQHVGIGLFALFKKRTNISYITFVNNMRISKACQLLANTTLSASEICYAWVASTTSRISSASSPKRKTCTPIEYREYISQMLIKY